MPVHQGHLALIEFAAAQCQQLVVSMSIRPDDAIGPELRLNWLRTLVADWPTIEVVGVLDDFSDDTLPLEQATQQWAAFIRLRFPDVEAFFCSEAYAEPLARHLGRPGILFDLSRQRVPVAASAVRRHPFRYWEFIPPVVRPYFVQKICLYGPESVGKTTLAAQLAAHYGTSFVPEAARELLLDNDFTLADILSIGQTQTTAVLVAAQTAHQLLFCDTDLVTTRLYSQLYLGTEPPELADLEQQVTYAHYFLLSPDVPWVADELRDQGHRRRELFELFRQALDVRGRPYTLVSGGWARRWATVTTTIDELVAALH
jgi:HTH-type transcriptional repressor of NAD biosynthesis genes